MSTKVVPLTDHIVLRAIQQEEITSSGLVIPDSAKEKPQHGEVLAVGPGKMNEAGVFETIDLVPGDRVLYSKYTGQEVTVDKSEYLVVRFNEILAKLVDDAAKGSAKGKASTAKAAPRRRR